MLKSVAFALVFAGACSPSLVDATLPSGEVPGIPNETAAAVARQERRHRMPDPLGQLQERYGVAPVVLPLGEITTDQLGTPITMHLDDYWRLEWGSRATFTLAAIDNPVGILRPNVVFIRPLALADPSVAPFMATLPGEASYPADDLSGWIEALPQVVLLGREEFSIGDRSVVRYDVDLDPSLGYTSSSCSPGDCIDLLWAGAGRRFILRDKETVRYYEIEDPQGPILVLVAADDGNDAFLERADRLVRALDVGESAPHPVPSDEMTAEVIIAPRGVWRVEAIDGLRLELLQATQLSERAGVVWVDPRPASGGTTVASIVQVHGDANGARLEDAADVTTHLGAVAGWIYEELGPTRVVVGGGATVEGVEFRLVRLDENDSSTPAVVTAPLLEGDDPRLAGWPTERVTHGVVVDMGGKPLVFAAEVSAEADESDTFALALELASRVVIETDS